MDKQNQSAVCPVLWKSLNQTNLQTLADDNGSPANYNKVLTAKNPTDEYCNGWIVFFIIRK
jgi:hypothetical protein